MTEPGEEIEEPNEVVISEMCPTGSDNVNGLSAPYTP